MKKLDYRFILVCMICGACARTATKVQGLSFAIDHDHLEITGITGTQEYDFIYKNPKHVQIIKYLGK